MQVTKFRAFGDALSKLNFDYDDSKLLEGLKKGCFSFDTKGSTSPKYVIIKGELAKTIEEAGLLPLAFKNTDRDVTLTVRRYIGLVLVCPHLGF